MFTAAVTLSAGDGTTLRGALWRAIVGPMNAWTTVSLSGAWRTLSPCGAWKTLSPCGAWKTLSPCGAWKKLCWLGFATALACGPSNEGGNADTEANEDGNTGSPNTTSVLTTAGGDDGAPMCSEPPPEGEFVACIGYYCPNQGTCLHDDPWEAWEVCTRGCRSDCNCWENNLGGTAKPLCRNADSDQAGTCVLSCENGETCPPTMSCLAELGICVYEPSPPDDFTGTGGSTGDGSGGADGSGTDSGSTSSASGESEGSTSSASTGELGGSGSSGSDGSGSSGSDGSGTS